MSNSIERAAEVLRRGLGWSFHHTATALAERLAAEGLLVTAELARLIRLGQAVEASRVFIEGLTVVEYHHLDMSWTECLDAIYAEAERGER